MCSENFFFLFWLQQQQFTTFPEFPVKRNTQKIWAINCRSQRFFSCCHLKRARQSSTINRLYIAFKPGRMSVEFRFPFCSKRLKRNKKPSHFSTYLKAHKFCVIFFSRWPKLCMCSRTALLPKNNSIYSKFGITVFAVSRLLLPNSLSSNVEIRVSTNADLKTHARTRPCVTQQSHVSVGIMCRLAAMSRWFTWFNFFFLYVGRTKAWVVWEKTSWLWSQLCVIAILKCMKLPLVF